MGLDHAEITMTGLGRMEEEAGGSGAGEGGGDLARDQPGLADTGGDQAAGLPITAALTDQPAGEFQSWGLAGCQLDQRGHGTCLGGEHVTDAGEGA